MIAPRLLETVRIMLFAAASHGQKHYFCHSTCCVMWHTKIMNGRDTDFDAAQSTNSGAKKPMVPLAGIEPATSGSTIRRSNHLSYNGTFAEPDQGGKFTFRDPLCRSAMRPYGLTDLNSRLLLGKGRFPTNSIDFSPGKEKGRREEVPAFSCYEPAGGGAGWSPRGAEGGGSARRVFLDGCHYTPDRF
jgi:hypothetical protein